LKKAQAPKRLKEGENLLIESWKKMGGNRPYVAGGKGREFPRQKKRGPLSGSEQPGFSRLDGTYATQTKLESRAWSLGDPVEGAEQRWGSLKKLGNKRTVPVNGGKSNKPRR